MTKYYIVPEKYKCIGDIYNSQEFKDFHCKRHSKIDTGISTLDSIIRNGIGPSNIDVIAGSTGKGYSMIEEFIKSQFDNIIDLQDDKKHAGKMIICLDLESQTPPLPPEPRIVKEGETSSDITYVVVGLGIIAYALIYWMLMSYAFNI